MEANDLFYFVLEPPDFHGLKLERNWFLFCFGATRLSQVETQTFKEKPALSNLLKRDL
jgi:hypothetical protein